MSQRLGAIADDFTGATDLASTLVKQGMRATRVIGVADDNTAIGDAEAVIVALKSRTEAAADAVYATAELEETAKLFLLLKNRKIRPLDAAQVADLKRIFPNPV